VAANRSGREELPRLDATLWRLSPAWLLLIIVGGYVAAIYRSRPAALIALGGVLALIATHLFVAVRHYRRTMRHPWPQVPPVDDWDD